MTITTLMIKTPLQFEMNLKNRHLKLQTNLNSISHFEKV